MWQDGLFVLDANVLLNLYRYSDHTREQLIDVLSEIKGRLWLPHQAAHEYMNRRLTVIDAQSKQYREFSKYLNELPAHIGNLTEGLHRDSAVKAKDLLDFEELRRCLGGLIAYLKEQEGGFPKVSSSPEEDAVWRTVDEIFVGKIGEPYPSDREREIFEEGKKRYEKGIPPGYEDRKKGQGEDEESGDRDRRFGDLLIWFQILDKAEAIKKPMVFVTDDRKKDWWWQAQGHTLGPRHELVDEIHQRAGVSFYMYRPDRFLEEARRFLGKDVSDEAINEAHELGPLTEELAEESTYHSLPEHLRETWRQVDEYTRMIPPEVRELQRQQAELDRMVPPEVRELQRRQAELEALIPREVRELERRRAELVAMIPPEVREIQRRQAETEAMIPPEVRRLQEQERRLRRDLGI